MDVAVLTSVREILRASASLTQSVAGFFCVYDATTSQLSWEGFRPGDRRPAVIIIMPAARPSWLSANDRHRRSTIDPLRRGSRTVAGCMAPWPGSARPGRQMCRRRLGRRRRCRRRRDTTRFIHARSSRPSADTGLPGWLGPSHGASVFAQDAIK